MIQYVETRTEFAHELALLRVADLGFRAVLFRLGALAALSLVAVLGDAPWYVAIPIAVAAVGGYLSARMNHYQRSDYREPRGPLTRLSLRITLSGAGRMAPDIPGTIEGLSYVPLACIGPWMMQDSAGVYRLAALAAALAWVASAVVAVFVDPGFYHPGADPRWRVVDWARQYLLGLVAAALAGGVVLPAPWTDSQRMVAAALCASLSAVQLRVRETDRLLTHAASTSRTREIAERHHMAEAVHDLVGTPTALLRVHISEDPKLLASVEQTVSDLEAGYSVVLSMENDLDRDVDWPGRLQAALDRLSRVYGGTFELLHHPDELHRVDRAIAHQVLHNFAMNALKAGARRSEFTLARNGRWLVAHATDDGVPISAQAWMRPGGGLSRARSRLERTGPGAAIEILHDGSGVHPKSIEARWHPHSDPGDAQ